MRQKISTYMKRAEELKGFLTEQRKVGKLHARVDIKNGQVGFSYPTVFSK